jgi:peptidyl-prolyl cis-trans isomerase B (cyclophilin B)
MKGMTATVDTSLGTIKIQLAPDAAPNNTRAFIRYAKSGIYDGATFFRVSGKYYMSAGFLDTWPQDSPNRKRFFSQVPGAFEPNTEKSVRGTLFIRQLQDAATSWYFFLISKDNPALDGKNDPIGHVVEGLDVVDKIAGAEVEGDAPKTRIEIKKITIQ